MKNVAAWVVAVGLLAGSVRFAHATEPFAKVGVFGATWVSFPLGIRNIGMGATGTSDVSGFATGYFNPASVASADATTLGGSYEDMYLGIDLSEFQIATPLPIRANSEPGAWRFAGSLAYARLGMDPQPARTIFLPEGTTTGTFDASDWMLAALAAAQWNHGGLSLSAGINTKYLRSNLAGGSASTWAFDSGVIAAFPIPVDGGLVRPRLGYAFLNLDTGASYDGRDWSVANEQRLGFGLDLDAPRATVWDRAVPLASLSLDYDRTDRQSYSRYEYAAGFEVSFLELAHVRYGLIDDLYTTYGLGVGWDYGPWLIRLDYAHTTPEPGVMPDLDDDWDRDTFGALFGVRW